MIATNSQKGEIYGKEIYKLGWGQGYIIDHENGMAGYVAGDKWIKESFRVPIGEITGFSSSKGRKMLRDNFQILGHGTVIGSAEVNSGVAEKLEAWFRSHLQFRQPVAVPHTTSAVAGTESVMSSGGPSVADEIAKLGKLKEQGLLTEEEFQAQKSRLLNG